MGGFLFYTNYLIIIFLQAKRHNCFVSYSSELHHFPLPPSGAVPLGWVVHHVPGVLVCPSVVLSLPRGELLPLPATLPNLQDHVDRNEVHQTLVYCILTLISPPVCSLPLLYSFTSSLLSHPFPSYSFLLTHTPPPLPSPSLPHHFPSLPLSLPSLIDSLPH